MKPPPPNPEEATSEPTPPTPSATQTRPAPVDNQQKPPVVVPPNQGDDWEAKAKSIFDAARARWSADTSLADQVRTPWAKSADPAPIADELLRAGLDGHAEPAAAANWAVQQLRQAGLLDDHHKAESMRRQLVAAANPEPDYYDVFPDGDELVPATEVRAAANHALAVHLHDLGPEPEDLDAQQHEYRAWLALAAERAAQLGATVDIDAIDVAVETPHERARAGVNRALNEISADLSPADARLALAAARAAVHDTAVPATQAASRITFVAGSLPPASAAARAIAQLIVDLPGTRDAQLAGDVRQFVDAFEAAFLAPGGPALSVHTASLFALAGIEPANQPASVSNGESGVSVQEFAARFGHLLPTARVQAEGGGDGSGSGGDGGEGGPADDSEADPSAAGGGRGTPNDFGAVAGQPAGEPTVTRTMWMRHVDRGPGRPRHLRLTLPATDLNALRSHLVFLHHMWDEHAMPGDTGGELLTQAEQATNLYDAMTALDTFVDRVNAETHPQLQALLAGDSEMVGSALGREDVARHMEVRLLEVVGELVLATTVSPADEIALRRVLLDAVQTLLALAANGEASAREVRRLGEAIVSMTYELPSTLSEQAQTDIALLRRSVAHLREVHPAPGPPELAQFVSGERTLITSAPELSFAGQLRDLAGDLVHTASLAHFNAEYERVTSQQSASAAEVAALAEHGQRLVAELVTSTRSLPSSDTWMEWSSRVEEGGAVLLRVRELLTVLGLDESAATVDGLADELAVIAGIADLIRNVRYPIPEGLWSALRTRTGQLSVPELPVPPAAAGMVDTEVLGELRGEWLARSWLGGAPYLDAAEPQLLGERFSEAVTYLHDQRDFADQEITARGRAHHAQLLADLAETIDGELMPLLASQVERGGLLAAAGWAALRRIAVDAGDIALDERAFHGRLDDDLAEVDLMARRLQTACRTAPGDPWRQLVGAAGGGRPFTVRNFVWMRDADGNIRLREVAMLIDPREDIPAQINEKLADEFLSFMEDHLRGTPDATASFAAYAACRQARGLSELVTTIDDLIAAVGEETSPNMAALYRRAAGISEDHDDRLRIAAEFQERVTAFIAHVQNAGFSAAERAMARSLLLQAVDLIQRVALIRTPDHVMITQLHSTAEQLFAAIEVHDGSVRDLRDTLGAFVDDYQILEEVRIDVEVRLDQYRGVMAHQLGLLGPVEVGLQVQIEGGLGRLYQDAAARAYRAPWVQLWTGGEMPADELASHGRRLTNLIRLRLADIHAQVAGAPDGEDLSLLVRRIDEVAGDCVSIAGIYAAFRDDAESMRQLAMQLSAVAAKLQALHDRDPGASTHAGRMLLGEAQLQLDDLASHYDPRRANPTLVAVSDGLRRIGQARGGSVVSLPEELAGSVDLLLFREQEYELARDRMEEAVPLPRFTSVVWTANGAELREFPLTEEGIDQCMDALSGWTFLDGRDVRSVAAELAQVRRRLRRLRTAMPEAERINALAATTDELNEQVMASIVNARTSRGRPSYDLQFLAHVGEALVDQACATVGDSTDTETLWQYVERHPQTAAIIDLLLRYAVISATRTTSDLDSDLRRFEFLARFRNAMREATDSSGARAATDTGRRIWETQDALDLGIAGMVANSNNRAPFTPGQGAGTDLPHIMFSETRSFLSGTIRNEQLLNEGEAFQLLMAECERVAVYYRDALGGEPGSTSIFNPDLFATMLESALGPAQEESASKSPDQERYSASMGEVRDLLDQRTAALIILAMLDGDVDRGQRHLTDLLEAVRRLPEEECPRARKIVVDLLRGSTVVAIPAETNIDYEDAFAPTSLLDSAGQRAFGAELRQTVAVGPLGGAAFTSNRERKEYVSRLARDVWQVRVAPGVTLTLPIDVVLPSEIVDQVDVATATATIMDGVLADALREAGVRRRAAAGDTSLVSAWHSVEQVLLEARTDILQDDMERARQLLGRLPGAHAEPPTAPMPASFTVGWGDLVVQGVPVEEILATLNALRWLPGMGVVPGFFDLIDRLEAEARVTLERAQARLASPDTYAADSARRIADGMLDQAQLDVLLFARNRLYDPEFVQVAARVLADWQSVVAYRGFADVVALAPATCAALAFCGRWVAPHGSAEPGTLEAQRHREFCQDLANVAMTHPIAYVVRQDFLRPLHPARPLSQVEFSDNMSVNVVPVVRADGTVELLALEHPEPKVVGTEVTNPPWVQGRLQLADLASQLGEDSPAAIHEAITAIGSGVVPHQTVSPPSTEAQVGAVREFGDRLTWLEEEATTQAALVAPAEMLAALTEFVAARGYELRARLVAHQLVDAVIAALLVRAKELAADGGSHAEILDVVRFIDTAGSLEADITARRAEVSNSRIESVHCSVRKRQAEARSQAITDFFSSPAADAAELQRLVARIADCNDYGFDTTDPAVEFVPLTVVERGGPGTLNAVTADVSLRMVGLYYHPDWPLLETAMLLAGEAIRIREDVAQQIRRTGNPDAPPTDRFGARLRDPVTGREAFPEPHAQTVLIRLEHAINLVLNGPRQGHSPQTLSSVVQGGPDGQLVNEVLEFLSSMEGINSDVLTSLRSPSYPRQSEMEQWQLLDPARRAHAGIAHLLATQLLPGLANGTISERQLAGDSVLNTLIVDEFALLLSRAVAYEQQNVNRRPEPAEHDDRQLPEGSHYAATDSDLGPWAHDDNGLDRENRAVIVAMMADLATLLQLVAETSDDALSDARARAVRLNIRLMDLLNPLAEGYGPVPAELLTDLAQFATVLRGSNVFAYVAVPAAADRFVQRMPRASLFYGRTYGVPVPLGTSVEVSVGALMRDEATEEMAAADEAAAVLAMAWERRYGAPPDSDTLLAPGALAARITEIVAAVREGRHPDQLNGDRFTRADAARLVREAVDTFQLTAVRLAYQLGESELAMRLAAPTSVDVDRLALLIGTPVLPAEMRLCALAPVGAWPVLRHSSDTEEEGERRRYGNEDGVSERRRLGWDAFQLANRAFDPMFSLFAFNNPEFARYVVNHLELVLVEAVDAIGQVRLIPLIADVILPTDHAWVDDYDMVAAVVDGGLAAAQPHVSGALGAHIGRLRQDLAAVLAEEENARDVYEIVADLRALPLLVARPGASAVSDRLDELDRTARLYGRLDDVADARVSDAAAVGAREQTAYGATPIWHRYATECDGILAALWGSTTVEPVGDPDLAEMRAAIAYFLTFAEFMGATIADAEPNVERILGGARDLLRALDEAIADDPGVGQPVERRWSGATTDQQGAIVAAFGDFFHPGARLPRPAPTGLGPFDGPSGRSIPNAEPRDELHLRLPAGETGEAGNAGDGPTVQQLVAVRLPWRDTRDAELGTCLLLVPAPDDPFPVPAHRRCRELLDDVLEQMRWEEEGDDPSGAVLTELRAAERLLRATRLQLATRLPVGATGTQESRVRTRQPDEMRKRLAQAPSVYELQSAVDELVELLEPRFGCDVEDPNNPPGLLVRIRDLVADFPLGTRLRDLPPDIGVALVATRARFLAQPRYAKLISSPPSSWEVRPDHWSAQQWRAMAPTYPYSPREPEVERITFGLRRLIHAGVLLAGDRLPDNGVLATAFLHGSDPEDLRNVEQAMAVLVDEEMIADGTVIGSPCAEPWGLAPGIRQVAQQLLHDEVDEDAVTLAGLVALGLTVKAAETAWRQLEHLGVVVDVPAPASEPPSPAPAPRRDRQPRPPLGYRRRPSSKPRTSAQAAAARRNAAMAREAMRSRRAERLDPGTNLVVAETERIRAWVRPPGDPATWAERGMREYPYPSKLIELAIAQAIAEQGLTEPLSPTSIARALGLNTPSSVRRAVYRMVDRGLLVKPTDTSNGPFEVPDEVDDAADVVAELRAEIEASASVRATRRVEVTDEIFGELTRDLFNRSQNVSDAMAAAVSWQRALAARADPGHPLALPSERELRTWHARLMRLHGISLADDRGRLRPGLREIYRDAAGHELSTAEVNATAHSLDLADDSEDGETRVRAALGWLLWPGERKPDVRPSNGTPGPTGGAVGADEPREVVEVRLSDDAVVSGWRNTMVADEAGEEPGSFIARDLKRRIGAGEIGDTLPPTAFLLKVYRPAATGALSTARAMLRADGFVMRFDAVVPEPVRVAVGRATAVAEAAWAAVGRHSLDDAGVAAVVEAIWQEVNQDFGDTAQAKAECLEWLGHFLAKAELAAPGGRLQRVLPTDAALPDEVVLAQITGLSPAEIGKVTFEWRRDDKSPIATVDPGTKRHVIRSVVGEEDHRVWLARALMSRKGKRGGGAGFQANALTLDDGPSVTPPPTSGPDVGGLGPAAPEFKPPDNGPR